MDYFKHGVAGAGSAGEDYAEVLPRNNLPLLDQSIFPFIANPNSAEAGQDLYNGNISGMTTTLYDINPASAQFGNPIPMASFYRYDQMNRLRKVQSYDHISSNGLSWQAYTQDDRFQMQLSYDLNGNILNLKRNGNNAAQLVMDDLNYYYHYLDNGNTLQNGQLPVTSGNTMNVATNRLGRLTEPAALSGNYTDDVDGLPLSGQANEVVYAYDAIGNLTRDLSEEIDEIKWNPYGKVTEVIRTTACQSKPDLLYEYDSFGQRIKKVVKPRAGGVLAPEHEWITHWYIRDAQGNVLAVYKQQSTEAFGVWHEQITLEEWDLYGSARLGTRTPESPLILANRTFELVNNQITNENIPSLAAASKKKFRKLGEKVFELVNHLGNIISTISDRKLMHEDLPNNPGVVHHYTAEILSVQEQYAFGMNMPGRSFSVEEYRYGFNGKENQDELMADNSSQDFGARMYDARVGRWWGMDPMKDLFKGITPYRFGLNNPIRYIDVGGGFEIDAAIKSKYKKFDTYLQNISKVYHSKPDEFKKIFKAMSQLSDQEIEKMLTYDAGPRIGVNSHNGGGYSYTPKKEITDQYGNKTVIQSPIFYIDIQVLDAFEKDENFDIAIDVADELDLEVSIFHESTHWGDQKDGKIDGDISYGGKNYRERERGNLFEELAYGQKLDTKDLLPYVKKNRQDQISELIRVRFNSDLAKTLKGVNKSFSAPVSTKRNVTRYRNVRNL